MRLSVLLPASAAALLLSACGAPVIDEGTVVEETFAPVTTVDRRPIENPRFDFSTIEVEESTRPSPEDLDPDLDGIPGTTTAIDLNDDGITDELHIDLDLDGEIDQVRLPHVDDIEVVLEGINPDDWSAPSPDAWSVTRVPAEQEGPDTIRVGLDADGDGVDELVAVDVDGDGRVERVEHDNDADGFPEFLCINHDFDAGCEETWEDTDGDGEHDENWFDSDLDGELELMDLSVWEPIWEIVRCPDVDGDDLEDFCELDWDGDGIPDSTVNLVVFWPEIPMDFDGDGIDDPTILFETPPEELEPPEGLSFQED